VLTDNDRRHIRAAEGWITLGDWQSAHDELEQVAPIERGHPDVLFPRVAIYFAAEKWEHAAEVAGALCRLVPDMPGGFVQLSIALYRMGRTREAYDLLLPIAHKFPDIPTVPYNLACYAAQLEDFTNARRWLHQSFDVGKRLGNDSFWKEQSLNDPDLEPLRRQHGLG
jgi:predicted Zn-dependent protease